MLLIANDDETVFARADKRLASRIRGCEHIHFDRYGIEELTAILDARAWWGLEAGAIERSELRTIADAAAGDARVAISILRSAARKAQRENAERITSGLVQSAIPTAREEVRRKTLDTLNPRSARCTRSSTITARSNRARRRFDRASHPSDDGNDPL